MATKKDEKKPSTPAKAAAPVVTQVTKTAAPAAEAKPAKTPKPPKELTPEQIAKKAANRARQDEMIKEGWKPEIGKFAMHGESKVKVTAFRDGGTFVADKKGKEYQVQDGILRPALERVLDPNSKSVIKADAKAKYGKYATLDGKKKGIDNGDAVAVKLRNIALPDLYKLVAKCVVTLDEKAGTQTAVREALELKYSKLNLGMQRMNLGNKLRAQFKADEKTIGDLLKA